jgi:hypothetical protein
MTFVYEVNEGYQVDVDWGSYVFAPSRLSAGNVTLRSYWPDNARERAEEALEAGRANGLPL